jgi:hypothetical protein
MSVWVCDWSHWQGIVLPAQRVADEGFGMVKLKAGGAIKEGRYFEDPLFFNNAVALLNEHRLIPAAFWYLMPGRASAQAGLFYDMLNAFDVASWGAFLDAEQAGVTWTDIHRFAVSWYRLTKDRPLALYTSQRFWNTLGAIPPVEVMFPFLEEAHWVPAAIREDTSRPYASQHARSINPAWWQVNYGGWETADMLQFTDRAMVAGKRTSASLYPGTWNRLRETLLG